LHKLTVILRQDILLGLNIAQADTCSLFMIGHESKDNLLSQLSLYSFGHFAN